MRAFYQKFISGRWLPVMLGVFVGGYAILAFNLLFLGHLPLLDRIRFRQYSLLDPAANFIDQQNYLINLTPLKNYLNKANEKIGPNKMSVYIEFLNSGANISVNKDLRIFPASLAKLPLAIAVMRKMESGVLDNHTMIEVRPEDLDPRSGNLYSTIPGTAYSVQDLVKALLVDSDNTAQHMLLKLISPNDMQNLIDETGLESLSDPQGKISAKEYTKFLRVLYTSSYLEREHSQTILKLLSESTFKDFLSSGLPNEVYFSNKYGEDKGQKIYSDSGIVYLQDRPYMITVMLQGIEEEEARTIMKDISSVTYAYFSSF